MLRMMILSFPILDGKGISRCCAVIRYGDFFVPYSWLNSSRDVKFFERR